MKPGSGKVSGHNINMQKISFYFYTVESEKLKTEFKKTTVGTFLVV